MDLFVNRDSHYVLGGEILACRNIGTSFFRLHYALTPETGVKTRLEGLEVVTIATTTGVEEWHASLTVVVIVESFEIAS